MWFLNRLVIIKESQVVKEKIQKYKQYQRIGWGGKEDPGETITVLERVDSMLKRRFLSERRNQKILVLTK